MKIICVGRNYRKHAEELHNEVPNDPVLFLKPDSAVLRNSEFYIPEFSNNIHYEVEILVKISRGGKYILEENARQHYDQIGLGIDFTARDLQSELKAKGLPWEKAKAFDGSAVISEFKSIDEFDPNEIHFSLKKNGEKVQDGNSKNMLFSIDRLISFVSQYFTLKTGDILFTGTPEGVGPVNENDVLEGFLEDLKLFSIKVH